MSNIGFDFDINIEVNDDEQEFTPKEIRTIIRNAIDHVAPRYGYKYCEDSTRVLTIKKVNTFFSRIIHSCDFAIVYNCKDGRQQYIRFNKDRRKKICGANCLIITSLRKIRMIIPINVHVRYLQNQKTKCVRKTAIENNCPQRSWQTLDSELTYRRQSSPEMKFIVSGENTGSPRNFCFVGYSFCWPQFIPLWRTEYTETVGTRGQERV